MAWRRLVQMPSVSPEVIGNSENLRRAIMDELERGRLTQPLDLEALRTTVPLLFWHHFSRAFERKARKLPKIGFSPFLGFRPGV